MLQFLVCQLILEQVHKVIIQLLEHLVLYHYQKDFYIKVKFKNKE